MRHVQIHRDPDIFLTAANDGEPILFVNGAAYGLDDVLPIEGMNAGAFVGRFLARSETGPGHFVETEAGRVLARRFLS